jgi:O-antigen/teichoic acid export membrane protein
VLSVFWLKPVISFRQINLAFKHHGSEALWMTGSALVQWFSGNFYVVTAAVWLGPVLLGVLRIGQYIFGLINILLQAIENYVLPKASSLSYSSFQTISYLKIIQKKMLLFMGSGLLFIAVLAKPILHLIKAEHIDELLTVIYGMCGVYILVIISYPIRIALRSLKLSKVFFTGYIINSVFSLGTAYMFIHQWGVLGVLAGLFFSQALLFIFWMSILQNKYKIIWK